VSHQLLFSLSQLFKSGAKLYHLVRCLRFNTEAQSLRLTQSIGLLVGSMIVALRVTRGQSTASDFVIFITYLAQVR
jgi:ATP-binding cassette subfamily B (MDR/TAP) protein 6